MVDAANLVIEEDDDLDGAKAEAVERDKPRVRRDNFMVNKDDSGKCPTIGNGAGLWIMIVEGRREKKVMARATRRSHFETGRGNGSL